MAPSKLIWILSIFTSVMITDIGVFGRVLDSLSEPLDARVEASVPTLRTDASRRWRRAVPEAHRERCAELSAPWLEDLHPAPVDNGTRLQLRIKPYSQGSSRGIVFPGKPLFNFVRRVYRCCQERVNCRSLRGIQGRRRGNRDVEFVLTEENLSVTVRRAEIHLQLSNPQHLDIHPVLPFLSKRNLPTRYSLESRGDVLELRVDLLFPFQSLQEAAVAAGAGRGPSLVNMRHAGLFSNGNPAGAKASARSLEDTDGNMMGSRDADTIPALDLGLVLGCRQDGSGVSCESSGVDLLHSPFVALYYQ